jgi:DNA-binding transcriptional MerR regulator
MTIGRLARKTGVSVDTLRFYELKGLIVRPRRMLSGYRN